MLWSKHDFVVPYSDCHRGQSDVVRDYWCYYKSVLRSVSSGLNFGHVAAALVFVFFIVFVIFLLLLEAEDLKLK